MRLHRRLRARSTPCVAQNYGVDGELYCAELSFDALMQRQGPRARSTSPCPSSPPSPGTSPWCATRHVTVGALEQCHPPRSQGACSRRSPSSTSTGARASPRARSRVAFNLALRADDRISHRRGGRRGREVHLGNLGERVGGRAAVSRPSASNQPPKGPVPWTGPFFFPFLSVRDKIPALRGGVFPRFLVCLPQNAGP